MPSPLHFDEPGGSSTTHLQPAHSACYRIIIRISFMMIICVHLYDYLEFDAMDILTMIGIIKEGYEHVVSLIPAFDRAYDRALRKWTDNKSLRHKFAERYLADWTRLIDFLSSPENINPCLRSFMEILVNEVMSDPATAARLAAEFSVRDYILDLSIKDDVAYTRNAVDILLERSSQSERNGLTDIVYEDVPDYIPLTVCDEYSEEEKMLMVLRGEDYETRLEELIIAGERRILLFSHPQRGKTTVLKKLAHDMQESGLFSPVMFNCRNYISNKPLEEQLFRRITNTVGTLLVFDGLDEIKEDDRENVRCELENISKNYPLASIVISCRLTHRVFVPSDGFRALRLQSMSYRALSEYVHTHCSDAASFLHHAYSSNASQFLDIPFFLKESLSYFAQYGTLPSSEVEVYEFFINRCFDEDKRRKPNRSSRISVKARLYKHVECLAFAMLVSQKMTVSSDEMAEDLGLTAEMIV